MSATGWLVVGVALWCALVARRRRRRSATVRLMSIAWRTEQHRQAHREQS